MPAHDHILDPTRTVLAVIDMQEAFRPVIADFPEIARRIVIMVQAAALLNLPILVTEQSPQKLGRTAPEILTALPPDTNPIDKTAFSSCGASSFVDALQTLHRPQVLLSGIETHVCVNQTAHDLLTHGYQVHLLTDCVSSRSQINKETGLAKMKISGVIPSTTEMALFELMRDATHPQFRAIQKLIK